MKNHLKHIDRSSNSRYINLIRALSPKLVSDRIAKETFPYNRIEDDETSSLSLIIAYIKQLLDEVEHDIMNYQNRGLCYLPKPKAEADNTDTKF